MGRLARKTKPHRNKRQFKPFTELERIAFTRKKYYNRGTLPSYTPKLNRLLADVVDAFSVVPEPPAESFEYESVNAHGAPVEPSQGLVKARLAIGDSKGASINASNVEDACVIMFHVKPDTSLWLVPKILIAMQQWWSEVQRIAPEKEVEMLGSIGDYAFWKLDAVRRIRIIMRRIVNRFCNIRYTSRPIRETPDTLYRKKRLAKNALDYAPLMTPKMRQSLRAYIMEWYRVMGKRYVADRFGTCCPREVVHDCWL